MPGAKSIDLDVLPQPDDTTCGPTCLHAVYRYWGHDLELPKLVQEIKPLPGGGTLAVSLACHALRRGFDAEIYTYNVQVFDPTWFSGDTDLAQRLRAQDAAKGDAKLSIATRSYLEFLSLGGHVRFEELTARLLRRFIDRDIPILTGLSATYLYGCPREIDDEYDDVRGEPAGHFVVVSGYDKQAPEVMVADPLQDNPGFGAHYYRVSTDRLIASILLGVVTYDANLLVITPKGTAASP